MQKSALREILVVEDDQDIAHLVQMHLQDAGYVVDAVHNGAAGLAKALAHAYDLVVLDLTLPGMEGLEVCRHLRARPDYPLILMLTSRSSELDRVLGLEIGADDYLTKPFSMRELLARVKALFRRMEAFGGRGPQGGLCPDEKKNISARDLSIDTDKRQVTLLLQDVSLTAKEFDLLLLFACHPGRVYTRAQLLDLVWGLGYEGYEHTVNSHINRLRAKIEKDSAHPLYLLTVWGVGYKFVERDA
ncbi:MAG: response regulator transcription factor [Armatimonadota bacterium]|nr:response regulator transcription factor [Armatimonadota bacterium]